MITIFADVSVSRGPLATTSASKLPCPATQSLEVASELALKTIPDRIEAIFGQIAEIAADADPKKFGLSKEASSFINEPSFDLTGEHTKEEVFIDHFGDLIIYLNELKRHLSDNPSLANREGCDSRFTSDSDSVCHKSYPFSYDSVNDLKLEVMRLRDDCLVARRSDQTVFPAGW